MTARTELSKEAFIFETILELIKAKRLDYEFGGSMGTTISGVGWDTKRPRSFKISRKTMWQSFKTLEKEGYLRHFGAANSKRYRLTDEAWAPIEQEIIKFKLIKKD